MNKKLLLLSLIFVAPQILVATEKPIAKSRRLYVCTCECKCADKISTTQNQSIFTSQLPTELIVHIINSSKYLQDAAQITSIFVQTNKQLNKLINNDIYCLNLIKILSQHFDCSNEEVAKTLQIKKARARHSLQAAFMFNCRHGINAEKIQNSLNQLKRDNVDVNFTYGENCQSIFMGPDYVTISPEIAQWLIENGANINIVCKEGRTPFSYLSNRLNVIPFFLNHPDFKVNFQDPQQGNTPLIQLLLYLNEPKHMFTSEGDNAKIFTYIQQLLQQGADPELENYVGKKPLDYAREIGKHHEVVQFIKNAIAKKNMHENHKIYEFNQFHIRPAQNRKLYTDHR